MIHPFNRKYIFSSVPLNHPLISEWKTHRSGKFYFYIQESLEFAISSNEQFELILLGYFVDPENTSFTNLQILDEILRTAKTVDEIISFTHRLCGRWVLAINHQNNFYVLNDATGLMQVFYHFSNDREVISSSDHLIARILDIPRSEKIEKEFFHDKDFILGFWLPGKSTLYENIFCLIPNLFLNIQKKITIRFWPQYKVSFPDSRSNFEAIHQLLIKYLDAVFGRYDVALAITGGLDSRLMLAYNKNRIQSLYTYTIDHEDIHTTDDMPIATDLALKYNLRYTFIDANVVVPSEFSEMMKMNSSLNRPLFTKMAYLLFTKYPPQKKSIHGVVNEIARTKYYYRPYRLRARDIGNMTFMGENKFAVKQFDDWLAEANGASLKYNVRLEDLFYLEQRMARWNSMNRNECDIAQDVFEPFNSRDFIFRILCMKQSDKKRFPNHLYDYLFSKTWDELMTIKYSDQSSPVRNLKMRAKEYAKAVLYFFS